MTILIGLRKAECALLLFLITLTIITLVMPLQVSGDSSGLSIVAVTQHNAAGTASIYPGSRNARVSVEIRNEESSPIRGVQGCFKFPEGFQVSAGSYTCSPALSVNGSWAREFAPGEVFLIRTRFDVSAGVKPGIYDLTVNVTYKLVDTEIQEYTVFTVGVVVSSYPVIELGVVDSWWSSVKVFPGTHGATLNIRLKNTGASDIVSGYGILTLQQPLEPREARTQIPSIPNGSTYVLTVEGIDVPPSANPGTYSASLKLNVTSRTEDGVTYESTVGVSLQVSVHSVETPYIVVVDSGWSYGVAYPEGRSLTLFLTIQNKGPHTVNSLVAVLRLPEGLKARDGRGYVVSSLNRPLNYGDVVTITFDDIVINASPRTNAIVADIYLRGLAVYRGAELWFDLALSVSATLMKEDILKISSVEWVYQGGVAEALPSSRDVILNVRLSNFGQDPLTVLNVSPTLPGFAKIKSVEGSCFAGVQAGSTCLLQLIMDLDPTADPGLHNATLEVTYVSRTGASLLYRTVNMSFQFLVSDPSNYKTDLVLSKVWWGAVNPTVSYGIENLYPLHIEISNVGRYVASYVYVKVRAPDSVEVIDGEGVCSTYLNPGTSCRLTPYVSLKDLNNDSLNLTILVSYYVTMYGSGIQVSLSYITAVPFSEHPPETLGRVSLINYGWLNNNPTYPVTQNATYVVTLINHCPYALTSILGELALPSGLTASKGLNRAYVPGPVQPNQVFQLMFSVNVGEVPPGVYEARLRLFYTVNSGGEGLGVTEELVTPILVNGVVHGLELISTSWIGRPAEPGTYGNILVIAMRNSEYPSITGLVADVTLPEGFVSSINNESRVRIAASSTLPQLPTQQIAGLQTQELLRYYMQVMSAQIPMQAQFSKGDYVYFTLPLNVLSVIPGTYYAELNTSFIDHWGGLRTQSFRIPLSVLGSPILIQVWSEGSLNFKGSREANMTLKILNIGTAPAYNVYLAVYPYGSYVVLPKSTPIYLDRLEPGSTVSVVIPVYLNPLSSAVAIPVTYGNVPFMAAVIYTTSNGLRQVMNSTFTVSIEPFIEFMLTDVKVTYTGSEVRLSCTLINVGNAQAQRVTVKLSSGGIEGDEVFVGDVDPSSQTSFIVTLKSSSYVENVKLTLSYRNPYNEVERLVREFGVPPAVTQPTQTTPAEVDTLRYGTLVLVAVFLALVAFILFRYLKAHPIPQVRE